MPDIKTVAKEVINYVHQNDRDAYEFWRAHAIFLARHVLSLDPVMVCIACGWPCKPKGECSRVGCCNNDG